MAIELKTYGDLKKTIKAISLKQKGEKVAGVALDTVIGLVPGLEAARTTFDFIKAAVSKPDVKKTKTWLDRLDIDDEMSAIVDDTVENGFMKMIAQTIDGEPDDKPLEPDFNMNAKMVNYLQDKYEGRHIAGIKEYNSKNTIKCQNKKCGWQWKLTDGGKDPYVCHKCGYDNSNSLEELHEGEFCPQCLAQYIRENINSLQEAEYKGRKVPLGKPMRGDVKKFKVYVKNDKGNVVKVNFGDPNMKIKKSNPKRRKSFRARHHCDTNPGPRWKARYWSCRKW
jgi:predicted Zn-ribbon and HTH transcriptional regulator